MKTWKPIAAVALISMGVTDCATNPATGERQLMLVSQRQEIEMGRQGAEQVRSMLGLYPNEELQRYVDRIGQAMAARSEYPDLPWSFGVVDDPVVNAFALPGGFIFVTRGILAYFDSEAELAAVLGHEIGHVTARHSAEQMSRAQLAQLGLGLGSVFVPEVGEYANVLGAGLGLLFLKFGRDDERQADELGLRYMTSLNYAPDEMVDVFAMLGRVSQAQSEGERLPTWLSTHPDPEDRQERIAALIQEQGAPSDGMVQRDEYLRRLDGMVYGQDPRNGFFRDNLFMHPNLRFRITFPQGWATQNMAQAVAAVSPREDAVIVLTLSQAESPEAAAQEFLSAQQIRSEGTTRRSISGYDAVWSRFTAQTQQGTLAGVTSFLSYDGRVYQLLGYTAAQSYRDYEPAFVSSFESFDRLTDRSALSVEPSRIDIVTLDRSMTMEEFAASRGGAVSAEALALLNGVEPGERLPAGRTLKAVRAGDLPASG